jgi:restriction endonuclease Mrr
MLEMKPGDLIIVPKFPQPFGQEFALLEVTGHYRFDETHLNDFGHCIPINPQTIREYAYNDNYDTKIISSKFTGYRRAINNVWKEPFIEAVKNLQQGTSPERTDGNGWLGDLQDRILTGTKERLSNLSPQSIEELVVKAFENTGYKVMRRNHYDGQGGDADILFSYRLPLLSETQNDDLKVFVQVKKRNGVDTDDVHGLEQLDRIAADEPFALKVLFTTADGFTEEAEGIAQEKEIMLIGGNTAMAFLSRGVMGPTTI